MVTAKFIKESDYYKSFICEGHADYADSGEDIVCAAISMLTINTANSIMAFTKDNIEPVNYEGFISWEFNAEYDEKTALLMDSLLLGLRTIEDIYGNEYLKLVIEEV